MEALRAYLTPNAKKQRITEEDSNAEDISDIEQDDMDDGLDAVGSLGTRNLDEALKHVEEKQPE